MRGKIFILVVFLFCFISSFVSAGFFGDISRKITGNVISEVESDFSKMSEDEVVTLYDENKDLIGDMTKEDVMKLYEENKEDLSLDLEDFDEVDGDFFSQEISKENLKFYLSMVSCILVKSVSDEIIDEIEVPKQVPFKNEVFDFYLNDEFVGSVVLEDKKIESFNCQISNKVTYKVFITSDLIIDAFTSSQSSEFNPFKFYSEKRKSGDLIIKPIGIFRKINFGFINFGLKIAELF